MVLSRLKPQSEKKLTKQICKVVLDHFEKQYIKELGESWIAVRDILTSPTCWQYAVLLNRFNYPFQLEKDLQVKRYHTLFQGYFPYYPKSLMCYVSRIPERIPSDKYQIGKIKGYYLLNAASLLPVLALELQNGERVLDMCAAPGGKSIALLQCAYPGYFHCNEYDNLRSRWLKRTLESFIPQPMTNIIKVTELDGRQIGHIHPEMFDKILVDAPCSNDRSWLISSDTQIASYRLNQRKKLPIIQIKLLRSAIKALRPGGSLVYSTCTLSKAENSDISVPTAANLYFAGVFRGGSRYSQENAKEYPLHKEPSRYSGKTQNRTLKITNYHDYT
ncbi:tRNA (cytosine(34)-C(5))-methyltransferase, mitochondrial isoform X3 [Sarcophilus harrisii]|uniref:NOP2/Sun RNA methyltransferase 3 n=1 Tax=Sarcophilus harrisii TaxID=9305 RepID=G3VJ02_SARHA|nr:tRNA (cytosine(34)-C(5))-methyltransferase, mitochondrial isoform X3 [Sarcophilus harrisii]